MLSQSGLPGKSAKCHDEDVNSDGLLDLVCQFENDLDAIEGDSIAVLMRATFVGTDIRGADAIHIVPTRPPAGANHRKAGTEHRAFAGSGRME